MSKKSGKGKGVPLAKASGRAATGSAIASVAKKRPGFPPTPSRAHARTLLLENDPPDLVDKHALRIAEAKFHPFELWAWFGRDMHQKREESVARLMSLKTGDNIIMRHVFAYGYAQMEGMLMILEALSAKGVSIGVWMVGLVSDDLIKYLKNDCWSNLSHLEKSKMNMRLLNALSEHQVYECWDSDLSNPRWPNSRINARITIAHLNAITEKAKAECRHMSRETRGSKLFCSGCGVELDRATGIRKAATKGGVPASCRTAAKRSPSKPIDP